MFNDRISDYFEGVAAKYLSAVDADPGTSNQHEIGGLPAAGFKRWLGTPGKGETAEFRFQARQVYMSDEAEAPLACDSEVTWYDCRRKVAHRGPEYRLYYHDSPVTRQLSAGDFFLIAKLKDGSLLMVFTPAGSSIEFQLRSLFGLGLIDDRFRPGTLDAISLLLPLRLMLEDLGIELSKPATTDETWLGRLVESFGGKTFPGTAEFSRFARESIAADVDPVAQPDDTLMGWMDHEEKLFRIYERHLVQDRLRAGFGLKGDDVDEFIGFSLSVQNRRKSRVGHAFEGHLDHLFRLHGLRFEQGRGKGKVTENNAKPDFLFPDFASYHSSAFPADNLFMLGAKTTCKDRWRQVLSEAKRIPGKHLVTLEAAISQSQTEEMRAHQLQLVVPAPIQGTYTAGQQAWLFSIEDFIGTIRQKQA